MKLFIIHGFNPFFMRDVILALDMIVIVSVGEAFPTQQILSHPRDQEHHGHNDQRDGTHGEQNECQNGKASLARPMGVSKCFVAKRLNALAHRFEGFNHGWQCTPMHRYARKCVGGAL